MQHDAHSRLRLAHDRIARRIAEAADDRRATANRPSIRRSVGRSFIRIGERLAAEPHLQPARSR